jgi:hypothetical protein
MRHFNILLLLLLVIGCASAQAQKAKPGPELKPLHLITGHWTYTGDYKPTPLGPGGKVTGEGNNQMILGGFFLQSQFKENGPMESQGLEIDSYDPVNKNFFGRGYEDDGTTYSGAFSVNGNTWTWEGKLVVAGKQYGFRGTSVFAADSMSFVSKGELSVDGKTWAPWYEQTYTKAKPAPPKK